MAGPFTNDQLNFRNAQVLANAIEICVRTFTETSGEDISSGVKGTTLTREAVCEFASARIAANLSHLTTGE